MFNNIYQYINRLILIVKPKKILYIAIDGVAPRAKMNQQRSRRFRAAFEAENLKIKETRLFDEWTRKGMDTPLIKETFDSNVITPGTQFMADLSKCLKDYIVDKMQNEKKWKHFNLVFSDANVAGEGEHKILEFIKLQRCFFLLI